MMEIRSLRTAVTSLALGLLMFGYASLLIPREHWRGSPETIRKERAGRLEELNFASYHGNIVYMKQLIAQGVDLNGQDKLGVTPLISAASGLQHEAVSLLLSHGADPSKVTKEGFSAYDFAHNQNDEELAHLLAKGR